MEKKKVRNSTGQGIKGGQEGREKRERKEEKEERALILGPLWVGLAKNSHGSLFPSLDHSILNCKMDGGTVLDDF